MPITYRIDSKRRVADVRYAGLVTIADLRTATQALIDDPLFVPDLMLLGDITGIDPRFTGSEMTAYQDWRKQLPRFGKIAIVASNDLEFGIGRQFEMATNAVGGEMRVFRSMKDARAWLGLSDV